MGQKSNPIALRLGIHHDFKSVGFYSKKTYKTVVFEDMKIRQKLFARLKSAGVGNIVIERSVGKIRITIYVVRPGIVIGRGGTGLEDLKRSIVSWLSEGKTSEKANQKIDLRVEPIKEPNLNAYLVATNVSDQLLRRLPFRRIMKQTVDRVMSAGAKGVRIVLSGRIGGAEIGRRERLQVGKVSLSTIRENIDFASIGSLTKSGYIGIKVWIDKN